jgi:hypothetical protein
MSEKTGQRAVAGCGCLSLIFLMLILMSWARHRQSVSQSEASVSAPSPTGIQYVKHNLPCALDKDAKPSILRAIITQDNEALAGLVERGKAIMLAQGTRFDAAVPEGDGFVWGHVRTGRQMGRDCSIMQAFLQDELPGTKGK